jgi:serine/threonine protein phosphatase PrpC
MRFTIFQDTAIGARNENQDRMGYCFTRESLLMVVADGMGGHLRGEVAAQITLQTCAALFQRLAQKAFEDPHEFLETSLHAAHQELLRYQAAFALPEAPRTTVVVAMVQDHQVWWAHAGDSRFYWLRDGAIVDRTRDHSKVETMLALGLISPEEQETHPERHKVLSCLGSPVAPTIEFSGPVRLQPGDHLVLCTDGFWSGLPEADFAQAFASNPLPTIVPELIQGAIDRHGRLADNATVLALHWEGGEDLQESRGPLSSLDVPEGAVTTTIAMGQIDDDEIPTNLSEDDIERQIAEIRAAIRRSDEGLEGVRP